MISVRHLTKLYRNGRGVKDLTFEVGEGEVFGYLGPNGAGKTTTIRNLLGFLRPDGGSCSIDALDCWREADSIQRFLGYIPGEIAFIDGMTGAGFLELLADMRQMQDRTRIQGLTERFQLDASGRIRRMSKGAKQKLGIVAACMHDPGVMVFDEPSAGLDPLMRRIFVDFIAEERRRGKTILMSSHDFDEIEDTCDRAGIIREGVLVDVQDIRALKERQRRVFVVTVASGEDAEYLRKTGLELAELEPLRFEAIVHGNVDRFVKALAGCTVNNLELRDMTLEEVFMQYYGEGRLP
ncbi:MAG: ABC transporter ATP-binding protein [Acidobacteria bacterium]|jgi:ABC-2 type transport system ATP-binding protein|nr:ABC transporter ATP-binding protein [Acidobacteriota bacterium]